MRSCSHACCRRPGRVNWGESLLRPFRSEGLLLRPSPALAHPPLIEPGRPQPPAGAWEPHALFYRRKFSPVVPQQPGTSCACICFRHAQPPSEGGVHAPAHIYAPCISPGFHSPHYLPNCTLLGIPKLSPILLRPLPACLPVPLGRLCDPSGQCEGAGEPDPDLWPRHPPRAGHRHRAAAGTSSSCHDSCHDAWCMLLFE